MALLFGWSVLCAVTAQAQLPSDPDHSVVRFRIGYGVSFFGDVDVELFDRDKPVTVSNFLAYVQSERYASTLLQRCVPGVLLQGGEWTVAAPFSTLPFESLTRIPTGPAIANEFGRGAIRSNVFGTLAMWRLPGDTNFATSEWFFNLGDNSDGTGATNFNTLSGGYTVFGQVLSGTNVLQFFNALAEGRGLLNMTNADYQTFCRPVQLVPDGLSAYPFEALPVAFTNQFGCPFYSDLFTVQVLLVSRPDASPPRVSITSPRADETVTNQDVVVMGFAADNAAVASVRVYWGLNPPILVALTNNTWTATLTNVPPGTNRFFVEAIDTAGLRAQAVRSFFRSVRVPLVLTIMGDGNVSGATNQQLLELTRGYTLTARPAPGNLFAGWDGDFPQPGPTLKFLMDSNTAVTAVFASNRFPLVRGAYQGLFFDPLSVEQQSSGFLMLSVGASGSYSCRLFMNGRSYRAVGSFHVDGKTTNFVARAGTNALLLRLALDPVGGTDQLTGSLTNNQLAHVDPSRSWSAQLQADRTLFHARTNPTPLAGQYTLVVPRDTNSLAPGGEGFGTVAVSSRGVVSLRMKLADGAQAVQRTALSKNAQWPLYLSLDRGKGGLISWVLFDTNRMDSDLEGLLNWFKQPQPRARYYPNGLTNEVTLVGSRYARPTEPGRVLDLTNAVVSFTGGDLAADFTNSIALDANSRVTNQSTNRLSLAIAKADGTFAGRVTLPGSARSLSFRGAVLQKQNLGSGFFLGTNVSGRVFLGR